LQAPSEELKAAAAYALGSIAVGNLDKYLPYLLEQITSQPKLQYFLLSSLKEVRRTLVRVGWVGGTGRPLRRSLRLLHDVWLIGLRILCDARHRHRTIWSLFGLTRVSFGESGRLKQTV
jgi:hypothetical protein